MSEEPAALASFLSALHPLKFCLHLPFLPALVFIHTTAALSSSYFLFYSPTPPTHPFSGVCAVFKMSTWQVITVTA